MRSIYLYFFASLLWNCLALAQSISTTPDEKKDLADDKALRALIAQLADESFDIREAAQKRLAAVGEPALPLLHMVAKESKDLEARERLRQLIESISSSLSKASTKPIAPRTRKKYAVPWVRVTRGSTDHKTEIRRRLAAARGRTRLNRAILTLRVPDQKRKRLPKMLSKFRV